MFQNPEIDPAALTSPENLTWRPLHPRFALRLQVGRLVYRIPFLISAAALLPLAPLDGLPAWVAELAPRVGVGVWCIAIILSVRDLAWPMVEVPRRGYVLRSQDIVFRAGVLWRSVVAVPFSRIQHTQTHSGPLDRRFGISTLTICPAGVATHDLEGLAADTAEELRAYISSRIEAEPPPLPARVSDVSRLPAAPMSDADPSPDVPADPDPPATEAFAPRDKR